MRLCFLADARSIHTLRWLEGCAGGTETDLISFDYHDLAAGPVTPASYAPTRARIHLVPRAAPGIVKTPLLARGLVRRIRPDIVHAHYATQYGFCAAFANVHPLVLTCWGSDILVDPQTSRLNREMVRFALSRADLVTVDGDYYRRVLEHDFGVPPEKIVRVSHGVDTTAFSPARRVADAVVGNGPMILYVRGFRPVYDPLTLVRALPAVLADHPDAVAVLAGAPGAAFDATVAEARALGVADAVRFAGNVAHADLPPYLASASVYVSTSTSDGGMPVSTLEAMASGCAMAVTDAGDHPGLAAENAAVVVPQRDPELLAGAIIHLLDHPACREQLGANARALACRDYDYAANMAAMRAHYDRLAAGWRP
jgi:glycosyltransferase involved in cell wall biosynthesis